MDQNAPTQQTMMRVVLMGYDDANNLVPVKMSGDSGGFAASDATISLGTDPVQVVPIYKPRLAGGGLSATPETIFTATTPTVEVKVYIACLSAATVTIQHVPSGQSAGTTYALMYQYSMTAGETLVLPIPKIETGDTIVADVSSISGFTFTIYGAEL
jgi:hypothetical protein